MVARAVDGVGVGVDVEARVAVDAEEEVVMNVAMTNVSYGTLANVRGTETLSVTVGVDGTLPNIPKPSLHDWCGLSLIIQNVNIRKT